MKRIRNSEFFLGIFYFAVLVEFIGYVLATIAIACLEFFDRMTITN